MENENLNVSANIQTKSNTKNIIAIIAIVVLFLGLLFVTFSYFNSPKKRLVSAINKVYSSLLDRESNSKINNILKNNIVGIEGETTINISGMDDTLKDFENTIIKYNYIEDKKSKKASIDFDSSINSNTLLNLYGLAKDDKVYLNFKNLINKYYHMEYIFGELLVVENNKDAEYIMDLLKDSIINNLDNDDFSKSKATLKINGESKKVEKVSFKFTDKWIVDVVADWAEKLKNDEKAIKIMTENNNISKEELNSRIEELAETAKNNKASEEFIFNMYVKDYTTTVKYELVIDTASIAYYEYKNNKEFSVSDDGITYLNVKVEDDKKISGSLMGMISLNGTYDENKLDLTLSYFTMQCNLSINTEEKLETDSYDSNTKMELKVVMNDEEYFNLTINSENTISKLDKINELNIPSSTDIDMMSDEDQTIIMDKLMENPIIQNFIDLVEQNSNTLESENSISF